VSGPAGRPAVAERVAGLATDLFAAIPSQTSTKDRRSLLAVQRSTARRFGRFAYLEIGSHLGGSIQPYLLDPRCEAIYSIDPRPPSQPDDRSRGCRVGYEGNSTERMLDRLRALAPGRVAIVRCFESDASRVDPAAIEPRPHVAFIDGEHTRRAVVSDFQFCRRVLAPGGTIVFDDFPIVYRGVLDVLRSLRRAGERFTSARLEGKAFAVFFDEDVLSGDPFLLRCRARNRFSLLRYGVKGVFRDLLERPGRP
jgi:methyltransferase family protein